MSGQVVTVKYTPPSGGQVWECGPFASAGEAEVFAEERRSRLVPGSFLHVGRLTSPEGMARYLTDRSIEHATMGPGADHA